MAAYVEGVYVNHPPEMRESEAIIRARTVPGAPLMVPQFVADALRADGVDVEALAAEGLVAVQQLMPFVKGPDGM